MNAVDGRLRDLISTGERQMAAQSYDAAVDTYRTALSEVAADAPAEVREEVEARLAAATRARDVSQRVAALLRDARYHQTAGRLPEAFRAAGQVLLVDPGNTAAMELRQQLMALSPELSKTTMEVEAPVVLAPVAPVIPEALQVEAVEAPVPPPPVAAAPDERPIEPPSFHLMEDDPAMLERADRREYSDEPPISILDPTPARTCESDGRKKAAVVAAVLAAVGAIAGALSSHPVRRNPSPPVETSAQSSEPVLISKVDPQYTDEARQAGIEGSVLLSVEVAPNGTATVLQVVKGLDPGLDQRAQEALHWWHFQPAMRSGEPVTGTTTVSVDFRLQ